MHEESHGTIVTPPDTPVRRDTSSDTALDAPLPAPEFSMMTPARDPNAPSLVTPPNTPQAPLHIQARALLRSTTDSFEVVGRQAERKFVSNFLKPFFRGDPDLDGSPTSLYISGSPGTGKTALVTSTLATLKTNVVRTVYINCMGLTDLDVLWSRVLSALDKSSLSGKTRPSRLRQFERKLAEKGFKWSAHSESCYHLSC
jgi:cell division control protein 6